MSEQAVSLSISIDGAAAVAAAGEAARLLDASPAWLSWLASKAFESLHEPVELVAADLNFDLASAAGDLRARAQLTDEFVLFVAALRAGNGESGAGVAFELQHDRLLKKKSANV